MHFSEVEMWQDIEPGRRQLQSPIDADRKRFSALALLLLGAILGAAYGRYTRYLPAKPQEEKQAYAAMAYDALLGAGMGGHAGLLVSALLSKKRREQEEDALFRPQSAP